MHTSWEGSSKTFLGKASNTVVCLQNRISTKAVKDQTPFEVWYDYKPSLKFLRVFGCLCFTYIPQVKRDKLDKKAEADIFVRYSTISKAYRVFQPHTSRIIVSRHVLFAGNEKWNWEELTKVNKIANAPNNLIFDSTTRRVWRWTTRRVWRWTTRCFGWWCTCQRRSFRWSRKTKPRSWLIDL